MQHQQLGAVHEPSSAAPAEAMRSVIQERYGPRPEGLVRVHAASVDRGTWHVMAGLPYPARLAGFGVRRPKHANPGRALAGTVEAVGPEVTGPAACSTVMPAARSAFPSTRPTVGEPLSCCWFPGERP